MELANLIPLLRAHGVRKFKNGDLEIEFESAGLDTQPEKAPAKHQDPPHMPADLRADETMNMDKILNWSASPDDGAGDVALTGDAPLDPPAELG